MGLFYGNASQFIAECIGVGANFIGIGILSYIVFKVIDLVVGLRVDAETEASGLDIPEMGVAGYVGVTDSLAMPELTRTHQMAAKIQPAEGR